MPRAIPTKKHTNLTNEITGEYYPRKHTRADYFYLIVGVLSLPVFLFMIADLIFGAENVTNYLAEILAQ